MFVDSASLIVSAILACSVTGIPSSLSGHTSHQRSRLDLYSPDTLAPRADTKVSDPTQVALYNQESELSSAYTSASRRVFLLDFDGTIAPFHNDPEQAVPTAANLNALRTLSNSKENTVWIISGRDQLFLHKWFGDIPGMGLSAEHGAMVREPDDTKWLSLAERFDMSWKRRVRNTMNEWSAKFAGSRTEEKQFSFSWHYRENPDADYAGLMAALDKIIAEHSYDIAVQPGDMVVEVKFNKVSKGNIVKDIVTRSFEGKLHARQSVVTGAKKIDFLFCAGDDTSDEAMFKALRETKDTEVDWADTFPFWVQNEGKPDKATYAKAKLLGPEKKVWNTVPALLSKFAELT